MNVKKDTSSASQVYKLGHCRCRVSWWAGLCRTAHAPT